MIVCNGRALAMLEILLLAVAVMLPLRLWQRRGEARQHRLDTAYDRARHLRLT